MSRLGLKEMALLFAAISTAACGTMINGTNAKVMVNSDPRGALVHVDGTPVAKTPATVSVKRDVHTLRLSKDGYEDGYAMLDTELSGWFIPSFLFGVLGVVIDVVTGGMWNVTPKQVYIELEESKKQSHGNLLDEEDRREVGTPLM